MSSSSERQPEPGGRPKGGWLKTGGFIAVAVGIIVFLRDLSAPWARFVYETADADRTQIVLLLVGLGALLPCLGAFALWATRRWGQLARLLWIPVAAGVFALLCLIPGKHDNGRTSAVLNEATQAAGDLFGASEALIGGAVGALIGIVLSAGLVGALIRPGDVDSSPNWRRILLLVGAYVGVWALTATVTVHVAGGDGGRGEWLPQLVDDLRAGDDGPLGSFDPAIEPVLVKEVSCDEAAKALEVDGTHPDLPDCRTAVVVHGRGVYGPERQVDGELVAVVVQTRRFADVAELERALDGAELVAALGLPAPPGETFTIPSPKALSVIVASEDPGGIPHPDDNSAESKPLTRALGYLLLGVATGFLIAP